MEHSVGFVFFKKRNKLYYADYNWECAVLRNILPTGIIETNQYITDDITLLYETADDIISNYNDVTCFFIDNDNVELSIRIAREMKEIDDKIETLFFYSNSSGITKEFPAVHISEVFNKLAELLQIDKTIHAENTNLELFSNRFLPVHQCKEIGLTIHYELNKGKIIQVSFESIVKEFEYIQNYLQDDYKIKLKISNIIIFLEDRKLLRYIQTQNKSYPYVIALNSNECTIEILTALNESGIKHIEYSINSLEAFNRISDLINIYGAAAKQNDIKFKLFLYIDSISNMEDELMLFFDKLINNYYIYEPIEIYLHSHTKFTKNLAHKYNRKNIQFFMECEPLINGIKSYYSGIYYNAAKSVNTKHIQIDKSDLIAENFNNLKDYTSINSAVYTFKKEKDSLYKTTKALVEEGDFFLNSYVEFEPTEDLNIYEIKIDDKITGVRLQKNKYTEANFKNTDMNFIELQDREDLEAFIQDIKSFQYEGIIKNPLMLDANIINSCRWIGIEPCCVEKLPRLMLDGRQLYSCLDCKKVIGESKSVQFENLQNVLALLEKEQIERRCHQCEAAYKCSKCAFLPEFLSIDKYCELVRSDLGIVDYIDCLSIVKGLLSSSELFKDCTAGDIVFATHYSKIDGEEVQRGTQNYILDKIIFFHNKKSNMNIVVNPYIGKIYGLNDEMMFISNLLLKGLEFEQIKSMLSKKYALEAGTAESAYKKAINLLSERGCLNRAEEL